MQVIRIPALSDNYIFLLHDRAKNIAAVVDPAEAEPVLKQLAELKAELVAIFNTHHHQDHVGGNKHLVQRFPKVTVYGGAEDQGRIPGQQVFLVENSRVQFADRIGEVLFIPGHTRAHIAYYFRPQQPDQTGDLFCGDTLFAGGCGRLFEGTPTQMVDSLSKLQSLPDDTRVWCAHEYTLKNLQFAVTVDTDNADLQKRYHEVQACRSRGESTIPSLLGTEKRTNPFLRYSQPTLQSTLLTNNSVETFARLRSMRDKF